MTIKVLLPYIEKYQLQLILDYYNMNKEPSEEPLELLDRCEGGFKINISYLIGQQANENDKIKQVRWSKGCLTSKGMISFTPLKISIRIADEISSKLPVTV